MISNDCCICFEQIYDPIYLNCNKFNDHCLCKECYINYIKHCIKCPICRLPIKNIKISIYFRYYKFIGFFINLLKEMVKKYCAEPKVARKTVKA